MPRVLVIDDEPAIRSSLSFALEDEHQVEVAASAADGLAAVQHDAPDLVLLDLRLGDDDGLELLQSIRSLTSGVVVVMMTAYGSIRSSVECMKAGAFNYITKPLDMEELRLTVAKGLEYGRLQGRVRDLTDEVAAPYTLEGTVGQSEAMRAVAAMVHKVKDIDSSILITGESGTGKELVARAIHFQGRRRERPLVVVNCAAIPSTLLESELFGYERGAFTGAIRSQKGKFEQADGGTIFLDEVAELDYSLQAKLLRVIQEKEVHPLGSSRGRRVDVRIVSATNRDLRERVAAGVFREDLYFRLNVIPIALPPLRERREDIPLLVNHFLGRLNAAMGRRIEGIHPDSLKVLMAYQFPGNVRELQNILERAVALATGPVIDLKDLPGDPGDILPGRSGGAGSGSVETGVIAVRVGETLAEVERRVILRTLDEHRGNRKVTAQVLGIGERTLRNKLAEYRVRPG